MKTLIYRILAYLLDSLIVAIILMACSYLPFLSKETASNNRIYESQKTLNDTYQKLNGDIAVFIKDKELTTEEITELKNNYADYAYLFADLKYDMDLYDEGASLKQNVEEEFVRLNNNLAYEQVSKQMILNILPIIIALIYFVLVPYLWHGQTLMKHLFRLRVVSVSGDEHISLWRYFKRAILANEVIFMIITLIYLLAFKQSLYIDLCNYLYYVQNIFELVSLVLLVINEEGRTIHDFVSGTKVIYEGANGQVND